MSHAWKYLEKDAYRKCAFCLIEEVYDEDAGWIWISSEDFMDCEKACSEQKGDRM